MSDIGNMLAGVMQATQKEQQKMEVQKSIESQKMTDGTDLKTFITMWDEFVRNFIHAGGVRDESELKKITLFDFMNWLRGQNV